ncbi:MAG: SNF2 helicase associated domain-containing protein [Armatimonadetes bacterium]|nr:SNF2 helicase associated domain-containing protein [Armatimonadota bacterium]
MSFTEKFAKYFNDSFRTRGSAYYRNGSVLLQPGDEGLFLATVLGARDFNVKVQVKNNIYRAECDCSYFQKWGAACEHIWAALLAAENQGCPGFNAVSSDDSCRRCVNDGVSKPVHSANAAACGGTPQKPAQVRPSRPGWEDLLDEVRVHEEREAKEIQKCRLKQDCEILYIIDAVAMPEKGAVTVDVAVRERKRDGEWGVPQTARFTSRQIALLPDSEDREIISVLKGASNSSYSYGGYCADLPLASHLTLSHPLYNILVPQMCRTDRCYLRCGQQNHELRVISWDEGPPWEFHLNLSLDESRRHYILQGVLCRDKEEMALTQPTLLLEDGLLFTTDQVGPLNDFGAFSWISRLRKKLSLSIPVSDQARLLKRILELPRLPRLSLPEELHYEEIKMPPRPRLVARTAKRTPPARRGFYAYRAPKQQSVNDESIIYGELSFDYNGTVLQANELKGAVFHVGERKLIVRDADAELEMAGLLGRIGFKEAHLDEIGAEALQISPKKFPKAVAALLEKGWHIEAEGKLYRSPGSFRISVSSGINWFDLDGKVEYDDQEATLPKLLEALRRGENMVQLGDGSFGLLPEEWLKKYVLIAGLGEVKEDTLRFSRRQALLLDALLAEQPAVWCDEAFAHTRSELRSFEGIGPENPPSTFVGELRHYQAEGLGWLSFLERFGFGGCLADDMGLGKTVQVLAFLETRRFQGLKKRPSLVVVPKSVVFNWREEAQRFTPQLKILEYAGLNRSDLREIFSDYDLIITTYGTLRRDIMDLRNIHFDYCILDEAQAIKNEDTATAKAARLLHAEHRLALSGTPIENHLGEIWSLFEFLNPGILGASSIFRLHTDQSYDPDEQTRSLLARGLRPFILRRTKAQVCKELPAKTEQTVYCEMEKTQKKLYDELLTHYRHTLLNRVQDEGLNKSKMHILEALLRLRQAACHPGLIDKTKIHEQSGKLDALLPQLYEILDENHKALVFSQFTSFLAILRKRLDGDQVVYEYLDGATRDRAGRVERFQNDPDCRLFLISLKAGGLGLNLTAADYVFLLDPWWNPAVEVQAIDRTHRIGQTKPIFAYRLIARDTVEEKVLELQDRKRDLADAIISADSSLFRNLTREDLELLLS